MRTLDDFLLAEGHDECLVIVPEDAVPPGIGPLRWAFDTARFAALVGGAAGPIFAVPLRQSLLAGDAALCDAIRSRPLKLQLGLDATQPLDVPLAGSSWIHRGDCSDSPTPPGRPPATPPLPTPMNDQIPHLSFAYDSLNRDGEGIAEMWAMNRFILTRPHTRMLVYHLHGDPMAGPKECCVTAGSATRILGRSFDSIGFARKWNAASLAALVASFNSQQGSNPKWRYEAHPPLFAWDHVQPAGRPADTGLRTEFGHRIVAKNAQAASVIAQHPDQLSKLSAVEFPFNSGRLVGHTIYEGGMSDRVRQHSLTLLLELEKSSAGLEAALEALKEATIDTEGLLAQLEANRAAIAQARGLATTLWDAPAADLPVADSAPQVARPTPRS